MSCGKTKCPGTGSGPLRHDACLTPNRKPPLPLAPGATVTVFQDPLTAPDPRNRHARRRPQISGLPPDAPADPIHQFVTQGAFFLLHLPQAQTK